MFSGSSHCRRRHAALDRRRGTCRPTVHTAVSRLMRREIRIVPLMAECGPFPTLCCRPVGACGLAAVHHGRRRRRRRRRAGGHAPVRPLGGPALKDPSSSISRQEATENDQNSGTHSASTGLPHAGRDRSALGASPEPWQPAMRHESATKRRARTEWRGAMSGIAGL